MAPSEILIFDDDPHVGPLLLECLKKAGYTVRLFSENSNLLALAQLHRPRLVILDIMIPGMDGMVASKALRADPKFKDLRIAVVSGKTAGAVAEQALKHGADIFLSKPFEVAEVIERIGRLIGPPAPAKAEPAAPAVLTVRGSRSGGEASSCVSLEIGDDLFLLDAGSGLLKANFPRTYRGVYVLLTHYHPDHVAGLRALARINDGAGVCVCGPNDPDVALSEILSSKCGGLRPKSFTLHEGAYQISSACALSCIYTNHPGATLALKVEVGGKKLVYCPDNEIVKAGKDGVDPMGKLKAFARGADLLIHDARYDVEDHLKHRSQGHSSCAEAVDLGVDAGVERLLLFHLDDSYSPSRLDAVESAAKAHAARQITALQVALAREGLEVAL